MILRDYQIEIANKANQILHDFKFVYLNMQVRTGKTLTALETANLFGAQNVLFITKKKAISSIKSDYELMAYKYNLTVINAESLHKINDSFDLIIADEAHQYAAFPKPSNRAKLFKQKFGHLPIIALSGTMSPESYSQIYHQFWLSNYSPFNQYTNFYKWAQTFVKVWQRDLGYGLINDYTKADYTKIKPIIDPYILTFTQNEAGFEATINEHILEVQMSEQTYKLVEKLKKDLIIEGKNEVILADTAVKLMNKVHQLYSGTVKFESGNSMVTDYSKAIFIKEKFEGKKIVIFYKFKEELNAITDTYKDLVTTDLSEFNDTNKSIALQIISGREGINLSAADCIVYYNIDFSAVSYFQSRDRMTTMQRKSNDIYWVFAVDGLESKIYKQVQKKKNFTLSNYARIKATS